MKERETVEEEKWLGGAEADALRCVWCGAEIAKNPMGGRAPEACPSCAAVRNKVYFRLRRKLGRVPSAAALDEATAAALCVKARPHGSQHGPPRPPDKTARCLFCGRERRVDARGYCRSCVREGLDAVHEETGRTNGWDRPPRRAVPVADGWRGRPVAGPSSRIARAAALLDDGVL